MGGLNNIVDLTNVNAEIEVIRSIAPIYGAYWNKGSSPALTRTHAAAALTTANVGTDGAWATNNFDNAEIYREIGEIEDTLGNIFIRIPKFYIRKQDGTVLKSWQISKYQHPGFYLPKCFYDFTNSKELPYVDVGKYKGSKAATKLQSVASAYPLISDTIVNFRTYAENNNAGGLLGYQQLDVHVVDVLQTLMIIEFATLDIQTVMRGFTAGNYVATDVATAATDPAGNVIIVANAVGSKYVVGQAISVGTTLGGNERFYGRTITAIDADTPGAGSTRITFDGAAVVLAINDILYNTGWKNGFSSTIAASSGSITSNSTGKYPCIYRGIESPFGDIWQAVDGINVNNYQAWIADDAGDYASNVFAAPYEQLGYVNHNADGYTTTMGYDADYPFAAFPTAITGSNTTYYSDYYYRAAGERVALVGGTLLIGLDAGAFGWYMGPLSSYTDTLFGARLIKKPL